MEKLKFDISGMTCSSCASHVNRAVSKLKGVKNVNVNLLLNNMEVEFDNKILKSDDIIQAVEKAGYVASLDGNKKESNKDTENKNEKNNLKLLKKKLIVSICFLIPLMYFSPPSAITNSSKLIGYISTRSTFPTGKDIPSFRSATSSREPAAIT